MRTAGEEVLGYQKTLKEEWISDRTWDLIAERKELHQKRHNCSSDNTAFYQAYIDKDREVKHSAQRDKREWQDEQSRGSSSPQ